MKVKELSSKMRNAVSVVMGGGVLAVALAASPVQAAEAAIPQRIVVDPVAVQNWDADITVTGRVQQDRGAGWVAAPAGLVVHFDSPDGQLQVTATVQASGRFSATFYPGPGNIIARVVGYGQVTETSARVLGWISSCTSTTRWVIRRPIRSTRFVERPLKFGER